MQPVIGVASNGFCLNPDTNANYANRKLTHVFWYCPKNYTPQLKFIGANAFARGTIGASTLTYVELPDSVRVIRDNAFVGCMSIKGMGVLDGIGVEDEVHLPSSLVYIDWSAISNAFDAGVNASIKRMVIPSSVAGLHRLSFG